MCSKKIDVYKSVILERKDFCGHDWSITGEFNQESVLDWRSRILQPLFIEFLYENKISTSEIY